MTIMNYYDNNKYKHNNVQSGDVSGRYYIYIYTYIHKLLNYSYVQINNTIDTSCDIARWCTLYRHLQTRYYGGYYLTINKFLQIIQLKLKNPSWQ